MPDWLSESLQHGTDLPLKLLFLRLLAAFVMGCLVACVYRLTMGNSNETGILGTLVLLSVVIALITLVIGSSVARAFSLVGALAIVRFRTVVEDTRDTAFVIFAVAVGMACGSDYLVGPLAAMPFVLVASWLFRPRRPAPRKVENKLQLRLATGGTVQQQVQELLLTRSPDSRLTAMATARGGASLDVTYLTAGLTTSAALALVAELQRIEGVQTVEWKEA